MARAQAGALRSNALRVLPAQPRSRSTTPLAATPGPCSLLAQHRPGPTSASGLTWLRAPLHGSYDDHGWNPYSHEDFVT
jgi:hypothetical protein